MRTLRSRPAILSCESGRRSCKRARSSAMRKQRTRRIRIATQARPAPGPALPARPNGTVAYSTLIPGNAITAAGQLLAGDPLTTVEITATLHAVVLCMNLTTFAWDAYYGQQRTVEQCDAEQRESWFAHFPGLCARFKYRGIWSLTNGACLLSGLAYNGVTPIDKELWDRCRNIDIIHIEFANSWKELLISWNMDTNTWLRNHVHKRVAKPGKKPGFKSTMLTFLTTAFWRGIAPGYYRGPDLLPRRSQPIKEHDQYFAAQPENKTAQVPHLRSPSLLFATQNVKHRPRRQQLRTHPPFAFKNPFAQRTYAKTRTQLLLSTLAISIQVHHPPRGLSAMHAL